MPIAVGMQVGPYSVNSRLGAGGMGEVYRALDTRLNREVAIKVLPSDFANDADRLRRFEQEARATSALNHPNILTVYDIGNHEGSPFLVAELLEGQELRDELNVGPLSVRKALDYAQQIAAGLAAAHDKGIVHRDLKPENLFITKDGRLKILDFGLAKLNPKALGLDVDTEAETMRPLTSPGVIMGTIGYMSPEQVRGGDADHRSDIFSFGMILYEMLSGQRAFSGASMADVMSAILKEEPAELPEINVKIRPALDKVVRRCLEKKPESRFQSASDLGFAIRTLTAQSGASSENAKARLADSQSIKNHGLPGSSKLPWLVAAVLAVALLASIAWIRLRSGEASPGEIPNLRYTISSPDGVNELRFPAISPDSRILVFGVLAGGKFDLWQRPMGSLVAQPLPGGNDVGGLQAWSPDSRSIAFPSEGKLKRLDLGSELPQTLCSLPGGGASTSGVSAWNREGVILFTDAGRIYRISATGGEPVLLLGSDKEKQDAMYRWPTFLPDGRHFVFLKTPPQGKSEIFLGALGNSESTRLFPADSQAIYVPSVKGKGFLLYARSEALMAQPFDPDSSSVSGEPTLFADRVGIADLSLAKVSVSNQGVIVYDKGDNDESTQISWVDRSGKVVGSVGAPGRIGNVRLSPDGKEVAFERLDPQTRTPDIYAIDLARGTSSRLTFDAASDMFPAWSPESSRIAWMRRGASQIYQKLLSGVGQEELLFKSDVFVKVEDWSPDGRYLIYTHFDPKTKSDLMLLPLEGERKPVPFLQTQFSEGWARFSPDGRRVVYSSDDQGRFEVYLQSFPSDGHKLQISTDGGSSPEWRGDGREIYYVSKDYKLMAVEIKPGSSLDAGAPKSLFDLGPPLRRKPSTFYSVTTSGDRFLFATSRETSASPQYTVVLNWEAGLKK